MVWCYTFEGLKNDPFWDIIKEKYLRVLCDNARFRSSPLACSFPLAARITENTGETCSQ
jgi:hypothetical protein